MRTLLTALLALPLFAAGASAQSYTIKIKDHPDAGKSATITEKAKVNTNVDISVNGKAVKNEKKVEIEDTAYTEKMVDAGQNKPAKFTRTYSKATKGVEGSAKALSHEGKAVTFELKGDKYEATGDDVTAKDLADLAKSVNGKPMSRMLPKKAVMVGDTWTIGKEALESLALGDLKDAADVSKMKAEGKLIKAYKKDGQQWGQIRVTVMVPVAKLGPLPLEKPINFEMKADIDAPIDGSSSAGAMTGAVTFRGEVNMEQNGMAITIALDVNGKFRKERSAEK